MAEDRSGGIASFGISFGSGKPGEKDPQPVEDSPFRIVVVAEVAASADWSTGRSPPADLVPVDAESFDRVMGQIAPTLAIEADDPFTAGAPPLRIDLVLRDRKSMRPSELVEQVPALRALAEARRVVQDVANRKLTAEAARAQLVRILPRPEWADSLVNEVRNEPRPVPAAARATERREAPPATPH
ncbi:MAG TPA: type VI secretion system contractile sheath small subunit, partial [Polyangiaceae bacterium]